jgi:SEC-C motif-containing protein
VAATAEELMRSRYSAYAVGDLDYVWRTWHPRTRPDTVTPSDEVWTGLQILDVVAGAQGDDEGVVEFRASYHRNRGSGTLHERSRFAVRARRWFYVDGELLR